MKTRGSLPSEAAAVVLLFSLVASGQSKLRRIDGWQKIAAVLSHARRRRRDDTRGDTDMADLLTSDRINHFILQTMVERGQAPHYTEIARALVVPSDEGRRLLHELRATGLPNFLFPDTELIAGFAPFSGRPNPSRITVDGQQKWFAE